MLTKSPFIICSKLQLLLLQFNKHISRKFLIIYFEKILYQNKQQVKRNVS